MRTTVKEGPNKGRQFYCCQKKNGVSCNFFLWADDIVSVQRCLHQQQKQQPQHQQQRCNKNQSQQQEMRCEHQTPEIECDCKSVAVMRTTVKEGPNKGRQFYCCQKKNGVSCNFFLWADDIVSVQRCLHGQGVKRKLSDITTPQRGRTLVHKAHGNSPNSTYHVSRTSSHEED